RAGPLDSGQDLGRHAPLVDPAVRRRGLHHRELAADVVGRHRHAEPLLHATDDVEVRERRLDHDDVGALGEVERHLAERLVAVGGVQWVAARVAERGRRLGRLTERAVEARGVLRRITHYRDVGEARRIERGADGADHAVEHTARRDQVGAGPGVTYAL